MKRVLCVCALGRNRSKYLAEYLNKKGYETKHEGVSCGKLKKCKKCELLHQEDVDWADVVIIVRRILVKPFKKNYAWKGKKIIVLDVTDSRKVAARKDPKWLKMDNETFQKTYVRGRLRNAIKPHLPL